MGTGLGDLWEAVSPALECSLHLQSRWFLVSSKPGRHSQAMPPLGVSRQMWAQPWFLFMQFMPSKREKEAKKCSKTCWHWSVVAEGHLRWDRMGR